MSTLILSHADVRSVLDAEAAIEAVERAFAAHGRGETQMPAKLYLSLPQHHGDFRAMPVYADGHAGVKWINSHPENPRRHGLPSVIGVFIYSDPETARPLAVMDATAFTAMRTGAAAAVATKYLARPGAGTLGIIGCGAQARAVLACQRHVMRLVGIRLHDVVATAAHEVASTIDDVPCRVATLEEAASADVVCTLTPSRKPLVLREHVRDGAHLNAMGADAPGKQELDPRILRDARVFLDDRAQASESGEVNVALREGILRPSQLAGTLGEVVAGLIPGRDEASLTVFDSTGLAVQDLAVARLIYDEARRRGLGREVDLVPEEL